METKDSNPLFIVHCHTLQMFKRNCGAVTNDTLLWPLESHVCLLCTQKKILCHSLCLGTKRTLWVLMNASTFSIVGTYFLPLLTHPISVGQPPSWLFNKQTLNMHEGVSLDCVVALAPAGLTERRCSSESQGVCVSYWGTDWGCAPSQSITQTRRALFMGYLQAQPKANSWTWE